MVGRIVSHYRVLKLLGSGGTGTVYQAEDTRLGRQVALKFLPADLARDRHALDRFQREARAASALNHARGIAGTRSHAVRAILEFRGHLFGARRDGGSIRLVREGRR